MQSPPDPGRPDLGAATEVLVDHEVSARDLEVVWDFLSTEAYWGRWRSREDLVCQVDNAWRIAVARDGGTGDLLGFARATSDGVAVAYLADVFVVPAARGRGVGSRLVASLLDDPAAARFRWMLHTDDAHDFYRQFGFGPPAGGRYLERDRPMTSAP